MIWIWIRAAAFTLLLPFLATNCSCRYHNHYTKDNTPIFQSNPYHHNENDGIEASCIIRTLNLKKICPTLPPLPPFLPQENSAGTQPSAKFELLAITFNRIQAIFDSKKKTQVGPFSRVGRGRVTTIFFYLALYKSFIYRLFGYIMTPKKGFSHFFSRTTCQTFMSKLLAN